MADITESFSQEKDGKGCEVDISELGDEAGSMHAITEDAGARKARIIHALRQIDGIDSSDADVVTDSRLMRVGRVSAQPEQEFIPPAEPIERYRIHTRTLIVLLLLLVGAFVGVDFLEKEKKKREKAACELLQKGQPLPASPTEVQMPDADSLYELIDECKTTHGINITYGCVAEGVLHTAGLNHEPSEISEELRAEAERLLKEVKCNQ